jgi:sporulation protein YlmC with PRC-barrel domain
VDDKMRNRIDLFIHPKKYFMQQISSKFIAIRTIAFAVISTAILSFSGKFGGDVFEIYLNNKLISQQFVSRHEAVKTLQLDQTVSDGKIIVHYSHCGQIGKDRYIIIKDLQNRVVKKWHFPDATGDEKNISCNVKEILDLQKNNGGQFALYYASKELPDGRLLASIVITDARRNS